MPHPSVLAGYEELLEVAEAILFSAPLPNGVIDKYRIIQKEVKDRIQSALARANSPSSSPSLRSSLHGSMAGDADRCAVLSEKLQQSKRKNAELKTQVTALEEQIAQMTQRVQKMQSMHASSAAELVAQTKHACESAAARMAQEAEARHQHDIAAARQAASEALEAERGFHASLVRKVDTLQQLFPELLLPAQQQAEAVSLSASRSGASSLPRAALTLFFESTRHALHLARQTREDLADARDEVRMWRMRAPLEEAHRFALQRHVSQVSERIAALQTELVAADGTPRGGLLQQRDDIIAQVSAVEKRMRAGWAPKQPPQQWPPELGEEEEPEQPSPQRRRMPKDAAASQRTTHDRTVEADSKWQMMDESGVEADERRDQMPQLQSVRERLDDRA